MKFDYRETIEMPMLPTTAHGYQFESRFRNRGTGAFLNTSGPGHQDLNPKHEGAGPGDFEQNQFDLVSLNRGRGFTIPESERFTGPTALNCNRDKSVPGPAAYHIQKQRHKRSTLGTGVDHSSISMSIPHASKKSFINTTLNTPGPTDYSPKPPKITGLAGVFAVERNPQKNQQRKIPKMESIFGLGCSVEEHILYVVFFCFIVCMSHISTNRFAFLGL